MEILDINMKHFGQFQDHHMRFRPGINIIYGGNETGKTTIHAFIRAMLYGLERGRGKKDEYQLRQPWENPAYFAGSMRLRVKGTIYRIERNFYKQDRSVRLINETEGLEETQDQTQLEQILGIMNESAFLNTVFVMQAHCETDEGMAAELQRYMVNMQDSGDGDLDVQSALERLKLQKKELERKKKREQEQVDEQLARKRVEAEYVGRELTQLTQQPEPEVGNVEWEEPLTETDEAETWISSEEVPNEQRWRQKRSTEKLLRLSTVLLVICGLLCIACGSFAASMPARFLFWAGGLLFLAAGIFFMLALGKNSARKRQQFQQKTASAAYDEERMRRRKQVKTQQINEEGINQGQRNADKRYPQMSREQEKQRLHWMKETRERQKEAKEVQMADLKRETESLYHEREALRSYDMEIEAIDLAMERIQTLSRNIYREAGADFQELASGILEQITEGRYTRLALDEKMQVKVSTPAQLLDLRQVSIGTMDQIYFALRMAAGQLFAEEEAPLILDEPFVMYDDERLEETMRWLEQSRRQVILFTCQERERKTLEIVRNKKRSL